MATDDPTAMWRDFVGQVEGLWGRVMEGRPPGQDAEGLRYMLRYLAAGIAACVEFDDAVHPEFGVLIENRRSWGLDCPDSKYAFTRVEPGATYRVTGNPGTATDLDMQIDSDHLADGRTTDWKCLERWRRGNGSLPVDASGDVSVTFTAPPDASYLHLREYFGDWEAEQPALLHVERMDAPLPPPPLALGDMKARMELLGLWLTAGASCWAELGRSLASGEPGPIQPFQPPEDATAMGGQAYGFGGYRCGADEAVILEFTPPACRYWSVSLATWFWESADIANRQCSLNHTQASVDADGVVRIALAHPDPGTANWLDAAGHVRGTIAIRLIDADFLPEVGYRTVPLTAVADELGAGTVTARQRAETLARRRRALVGRYRR